MMQGAAGEVWAAESWACGGLGSALMWFCQGPLCPACLVSWAVQKTWQETRHRH